MYMGHYEIKPHVYESFNEENKCVRSNDMLQNRLMYLY